MVFGSCESTDYPCLSPFVWYDPREDAGRVHPAHPGRRACRSSHRRLSSCSRGDGPRSSERRGCGPWRDPTGHRTAVLDSRYFDQIVQQARTRGPLASICARHQAAVPAEGACQAGTQLGRKRRAVSEGDEFSAPHDAPDTAGGPTLVRLRRWLHDPTLAEDVGGDRLRGDADDTVRITT